MKESLLDQGPNGRYSRQMILKDFGQEGQKKLLKSKVLIVGAGGLGSPCAMYLAASGVGFIGIMDDDRVELHNLQRQISHHTSDVGRTKVESTAEKLKQINPEIHIEHHPIRLRPESTEILSKYDFVIDGTDNFTSKFLINDACVLQNIPFSYGGALEFTGMSMTVLPQKTTCYRCIYIEPPPLEAIPNCSQTGVLGPLTGIVGSFQASEAIKYLLGSGELMVNHMLEINLFKATFRKIPFQKNPECPTCGQHPKITKVSTEGAQSSACSSAERFLLTFANTQSVLNAERALKSHHLKLEPRVTPRQLSHECGICLEVSGGESTLKKCQKILVSKKIDLVRHFDSK